MAERPLAPPLAALTELPSTLKRGLPKASRTYVPRVKVRCSMEITDRQAGLFPEKGPRAVHASDASSVGRMRWSHHSLAFSVAGESITRMPAALACTEVLCKFIICRVRPPAPMLEVILPTSCKCSLQHGQWPSFYPWQTSLRCSPPVRSPFVNLPLDQSWFISDFPGVTMQPALA